MDLFGFTGVMGGRSGYICDAFKTSIIYNGIDKYYSHMLEKFDQDKICADTDDFIIIIDGVILNKHELMSSTQADDWVSTVIKLYFAHGEAFFQVFAGSFAGILYDKKNKKHVIFSDHIGTKYLYYTFVNGILCCSSLIKNVYDFLKQEKINYAISEENAYLLLTYGYMLEDKTLCNKIFKIRPGCYLVFQDGKIKEKKFFLLDNSPRDNVTEDEWVEEMDSVFRKAVRLQFVKDREYGYHHFVGLSGGLDSRMTCWVAHELGFTNQLNYTFSQSNYYDEIIAKKIASDLKHEWIFKILDHGEWLLDIDSIIKITGGNYLYLGSAHSNSLYKYINFDSLGMIHSGQIGDVVFGTFYKGNDPKKKFELGEYAYSTRLLTKIRDIHLSDNFKNEEIANFYYRGFSGANSAQIASMRYSETFSPFFHIDVLKVAMSIPLRYRQNHKIYKRWITQKYPGAAMYKWEGMHAKITVPSVNIKGHPVAISQIIPKMFNKILSSYGVDTGKTSMNPLMFYFRNNEKLKSMLLKYFDETIEYVDNINLKNDLIGIKKVCEPREFLQAITLLSAIKNFYVLI